MKHVLRVRSLLLLIALIGLCMEGARTVKYIAYCKTRTREHDAALTYCREVERISLQTPVMIEASYLGHYRRMKEATKKEQAFWESQLSEPDLSDRDRQTTLRNIEELKQDDEEWEDTMRQEKTENEAEIREALSMAKIAHEWGAHHGRLKAKYEAAARRPWIWLSPDEPAPRISFWYQSELDAMTPHSRSR